MKALLFKITIIISFLSVTFFSISCQDRKTDNNIEIKKLLPEGKIQFEVLDSMETTDRQIELSYKFQQAYRENLDVFNAYFDKTRNNQKAKYPENEILPENEFLEYMDFAKNIKLLPSRTEIIEVIYSNDNQISFKASGKLAEIFSQIRYNTKTNTFNLANHYTLNFKDSVEVKTNTNAFKEAWKGYIWEFSNTKNIDIEAGELPNMETIDKMSIQQYKIRLGKLSSGKTVVIIGLKDLREGNWVTNVEITLRMK